MFAFKKKYYLIIESIKDINLCNIKKYNKFLIIYRNQKIKENLKEVQKFRKRCRLKGVDFFVANDIKLAVNLQSDGIYLSSYNKSLNLKNSRFKIIGSAHNIKEINFKIKQGCKNILLSKLFLVDYDTKYSFLDVVKFNNHAINSNYKIIPLGGIKISNLNKIKTVVCKGFALLSEVKKKPANIINRLF
jgi:thiamine-phosphate pyrophosphorylase